MKYLCLAAGMFCAASGAWAQNVPFASFEKASAQILADPHDLVIGPDGQLYIADKFAARVVVMDPETLEVTGVIGDGKLPGVHDVSFLADGTLAIAVTGAGRVLVVEPSGKGSVKYQLPVSRTEGVLAHSNGKVYATDAGFGAIISFEGDTPTGLVEGGHFGVHDIAEAPDGTIWIADMGNRQLVQYSEDLKRIGEIDHAKFGFLGPRYLDIDYLGRIVVADQDSHRILMIDPKGEDGGTLLGVIGDGSPGMGPGKFDDPEGVAIFGNQYFFADSDNNRIVRYSVVTN